MKTKKILFLVNHDIVIYNFRKELVERLLEEGYEVYISSPYGERIDYLTSMGCHYIETKINRHGTNIIEDLRLLRTYKRIMKDVSPDVVDRKSTRLNSSHVAISYAVFCLTKKKVTQI